MKVSEIMEKNVVTSRSDEKISRVLSRMEKHRIHQLPIVNDGKYAGMVVLKDILSNAYEPGKTLIEKFKVNVHILKPSEDLDGAVVKIINSGYRALPVVSNNSVAGIVSLTDLIKHVNYRHDDIVGHFTRNVIKIKEGSNIGEALSLMNQNNISRLPVIDQDKILGCFDALSMIEFLKFPHESIRFSNLTAVEKESLKDFIVKYYMRPTITMETNEFSIDKVIDNLQSYEEVVLTKNGLPVGMITPRDMLKHAIVEEIPQIQISKYKKMDTMLYARFQNLIESFVKKTSIGHPVRKISVDIKSPKNNKSGRCLLKAKLTTRHKVFHAQSEAWNAIDATHEILDNLQKQLEKHREKRDIAKNSRRKIIKDE